jgi:hypothetical protein
VEWVRDNTLAGLFTDDTAFKQSAVLERSYHRTGGNIE